MGMLRWEASLAQLLFKAMTSIKAVVNVLPKDGPA
jgi:hypothetical protein